MPSPLPTHPTSPSFHDAAPELAELLRHLPLHVLAPLLGRVRREAWKARQQVVRPLEMLEAIEDGIRVMAHEVPGGGALHELVEREGLLALGAAVQEAGVLVHALTDPSPVSTCVDLIATDADALTDAQRLALRAEVERLLPEAHAAMALQASKAGAGATKDPLDMTQAEREAELAAIARLWFRLPWARRDGTPAQSAVSAPGATNASATEVLGWLDEVKLEGCARLAPQESPDQRPASPLPTIEGGAKWVDPKGHVHTASPTTGEGWVGLRQMQRDLDQRAQAMLAMGEELQAAVIEAGATVPRILVQAALKASGMLQVQARDMAAPTDDALAQASTGDGWGDGIEVRITMGQRLATPPADPCGRVVTAAELGQPAACSTCHDDPKAAYPCPSCGKGGTADDVVDPALLNRSTRSTP